MSTYFRTDLDVDTQLHGSDTNSSFDLGFGVVHRYCRKTPYTGERVFVILGALDNKEFGFIVGDHQRNRTFLRRPHHNAFREQLYATLSLWLPP
ncbi:hypothetical protein MBOT_40660 [Mycobacterium botniense]|uniref:Uncharacterized protein n=1 Tax=Mycobacterium botniense TaxID=84962 RepID=A0A7I9Y3S3_9MYCO|nr:hypothetical protein MBOT_40660 [Mycobacterium botniense]